MPELLRALVELTAQRDRDVLDARLVDLVAVCADALQVQLYRCVGDPAAPHLLMCRSRQRHGHAGRPPDNAWTALHDLPALSALPLHARAMADGTALVDAPDGRNGVMTLWPLWVGSQRVGLIEARTSAPLAAAPMGLIEALVGIYRNQLGLLDYGECDSLTGLLNRKTFDEQFNKCLAEDVHRQAQPDGGVDRRSGGALRHWLGLIDIDHFKRVNDNHGHLIGDEVLLLVGRLLRSGFRHDDRLYRFGGEEFVVLLRAPTRGEAGLAFERFRSRMEAFAFPQVGRITASVGFTELRPLDTASRAFERADQAVYHAKANGRNQLWSHEALVEAGVLADHELVGDIELF